MTVWELKNAALNDFAPLVAAQNADIDAGVFDARGLPLSWQEPPRLAVFVEPRKTRPKPRADISGLRPGALVLNDKAMDVLGKVLTRFGQLLAVDVEGQREWFYNVTTMLDCIDEASSDKRSTGAIARERFHSDRIPTEPTVFKDPRTARTRIYANDAARLLLQGLLDEAGITGAMFDEAGVAPTSRKSRA